MTLLEAAEKKFRMQDKLGIPVLLIKKTDHPHVTGDYFYAIAESEKRLWTAGESVVSQEDITEAWYAADCPPLYGTGR